MPLKLKMATENCLANRNQRERHSISRTSLLRGCQNEIILKFSMNWSIINPLGFVLRQPIKRFKVRALK